MLEEKWTKQDIQRRQLSQKRIQQLHRKHPALMKKQQHSQLRIQQLLMQHRLQPHSSQQRYDQRQNSSQLQYQQQRSSQRQFSQQRHSSQQRVQLGKLLLLILKTEVPIIHSLISQEILLKIRAL